MKLCTSPECSDNSRREANATRDKRLGRTGMCLTEVRSQVFHFFRLYITHNSCGTIGRGQLCWHAGLMEVKMQLSGVPHEQAEM